MIPSLTTISPLASTASVSPAPIVIVVLPPLNVIKGLRALLLCAALIPSSLEFIVIFPSFISICVASKPSAASTFISPPLTTIVVVACNPSSPALILNVPPVISIFPTESSSLFSACNPSSVAFIVNVPSLTSMESFALTAFLLELIAYSPPSNLISSFPVMALRESASEESTVRSASPLNLRSSFA